MLGPGLSDAARRNQYADRARHAPAALDDAVRVRLRADVPVACYLSGGLDSSAVIGLAARHASAPPDVFTVAFDAASQDECVVAEETARYVGARHSRLLVTQSDLADHFADAVWHSETVNPNTNGVAKYLLSRTVRDAMRVVLTGEGADETAAGYDFLVRDMLAFGGKRTVRRERRQAVFARPGLPTGEGSAVATTAVQERLGFVPSWISWFAEAAAHAHALVARLHRGVQRPRSLSGLSGQPGLRGAARRSRAGASVSLSLEQVHVRESAAEPAQRSDGDGAFQWRDASRISMTGWSTCCVRRRCR